MHDAAAYGDLCADFYDEIYPVPSTAALQRLRQLAQGRAVLDAGCGTGRYLLPLAARGLAVHGIEASDAMIAQLRAKPGGDAIDVTRGDFSRIDAPGEYGLVICLADTLALLRDREAQARAVRRLATRVAHDGVLLFETSPRERDAGANVMLQTRDGPRRYVAELCPVLVEDLDQWALQSGLVATARWSDWRGNTWTGGAGLVLSCYRRR